jgi:hypothetical protein
MKNNKLTFAEILSQFKPEPLSVGESCHIISKMTTQRTGKGKQDKLYQVKHKQRLRDESLNIYMCI